VAYKYDVFLSYPRRTGVWVKEHFYRALEDGLANEMPRDPMIFVDWRQETGVVWPENLATALQESRVMVSVLSPPYFRSHWCMAEWSTMRRRQELLELGTRRHPRVLTYPVIFADGDHFPPEAHEITHIDLRKWSYNLSYKTYSTSRAYPDFLREVRRFAVELAPCIDQVPEWQPDWPIMKVQPMPEVRADIPRLWDEPDEPI
jgi:hypothetical protein